MRDHPANGSHRTSSTVNSAGDDSIGTPWYETARLSASDPQIADLHHAGHQIRVLKRPTKHGRHSGEQFGGRERFDQIVVGALAQTTHAVLFAGSRGQHDHLHV